jgi:hypothetical protein
MWIVTILYWLQLFICPVLICGISGFFITKDLPVVALIIGVVIGVVAAEYVRRKIGLDTFFAGIYGSKQINDKLDEKKKPGVND